ncbi:hypothetical protein FQN54_008706 [Arachnomyces sp. PD_36]|nr:hypothetical protein FQN54_008706 [Arachnomyces sp. PD_36]
MSPSMFAENNTPWYSSSEEDSGRSDAIYIEPSPTEPGWVPIVAHAEIYTAIDIGAIQPETTLRLTRSDGIQQTPPLDRSDAEHVYFIAYNHGDGHDVGKRMALGRKLAERFDVVLLNETPSDSQGRLNWHTLGRVSQLALTPKMERFTRRTKKKNLANEIRNWADKYVDRWASFFFRCTNTDDNVLIPQTALKMAQTKFR